MANPNQNQQNQNDPQRGGQQGNPGREQQGGGSTSPASSSSRIRTAAISRADRVAKAQGR